MLAATMLAFAQQPSTGTAGQGLANIKIDVEDSSGTVVKTDTSTVTISVASGPGGFAVGSTTSVAAVKGVATFNNLTLDTAGTYTLTVIDGTLTGATSTNIVVSAAGASQVAFQQVPTTGTAGQAVAPAVTVAVEDAFGNVVTTNTSNVKIALATGPGVLTTGSTTRVAAVNGVATFNNLVLDTAGAYTLQATDNSLTASISSNITINSGTSTQLAYSKLATTGTAGQALSPAIQVAVEDAFGNVVTTDASTVTIAVATGPGGFTGSTTSVAAVGGVATFNNLVLDTSGTYTLTSTDGSLTNVTSGSIVIAAASASQLVDQLVPTTGTAGQALSPSLKVAVEDAFGNLVTTDTSTVTIGVASGPGGFTGSTTSTSAVSGIATFSNLYLDTAGTYTLTATDGTLKSVTSGSIVISAATASQLAYQQIVTTGTAGQALAPAVTVAVEDAFGNVVMTNTSTVKIAVASGPGGFIGSTTNVAAVNGVATFSNLVLDTAGTYTLHATDGSLTAVTSGNITVNAAAATQLVYEQAPTPVTAGQAIAPAVQVAVEDVFGNVVTTDTSTVMIAVATGPGGFIGGSTTNVAAVGGVATFNNLILGIAGNYTLTATDGALTSVTSARFAVSVAPASQLVYTRSVSTGTAGQALSPSLTVAVEDAFGNLISTDTSTVTIAVASGPGGFDVASTTSAVAASGVATFSNLLLDTSGTYTLTVTDGTLTSATSPNIVVNAATASQLLYQQIVTTGTAGQALAPAVTVVVEDAFGNVVTSDTSNIKIAVASGPVGFTGSTTNVAAVSGVATFNNLVLDTAGSYSLQATDGSLTAAISGNITINPAAASQLVYEQAPTPVTAGQTIAPAVQVAVEDAFGNVITSDTSTVTIAVASGPGGFTAGSTTSVAAVAGVATFDPLVLDTSGNYSLTATDGALASVTSKKFAVSTAPASQLVYTRVATTGTAGQILRPTLRVSVEDAFGNVVTSDTSTITVAVESGPGDFDPASTTSVATTNGVAKLTNLILDTAGTYTLVASNGTLPSSISGDIVVSAASASQLVLEQAPTTGIAGQALSPSVTVEVEDAFGNLATANTSTVKIALASGPGGFDTASTTSAAVTGGIATFSNLILDTPGQYTFSLSDGKLTGATTGTINIGSGTASQLVLQQSPTSGTAGEALSPSITVAVEDAVGNVLTSDSSTVTVSIATGAGGFDAGSTTSVTVVNGIATFSNVILDTAGSYTLSLSDGTLTAATTGTITIVAGSATQLVLQQSPTSGTAGQALSPSVTVAVEDSFGNVITGDTSTVTVAVATGPAGFDAGSTTSMAAVGGVATFSNLLFDTTGNFTLSVSDGGLTGATTGSITISPALASQLVLEQSPTTGTAGQALAPSLTVIVEDIFGNVVTGDASTVTVAVATGPAGFAAGSTTSVTPVSGVATFSNLVLDTAGNYTLFVSDGALTGVTTGSITISAGLASQLVLQQSPTSGTAGQALGALQVAVEDSFGNVITGDTSTVTVTVATGPAGFTTGSTTSATVAGGIATLSNLILDTTGNYTLSLSDTGLTGITTGSITISPTSASQLVLQQSPTSGTAGQALNALKVAVEDTFGNMVTSDTSTVMISVATGPSGFAAGSTTSVAAVSGVATFSNLLFDTTGNYTLSVSDGGLTGATTGSITISPAFASKLVVQQSPTGGTAGQALSALKIAVEDAFGNVMTGDSSTVMVAVATGPGGFATGSTTSAAAVNGVATLSNLTFDTAGTYTLTVTDGTLTSETSGNVVVSPATASQLAYQQTPTTGATGQPLSPAVVVDIEDTFGNVVTSNTSSVTIAVASGPGGFATGSTTSVSAAGGVATFSNLMLNTAGNYTLSVTDGTLTGVTSTSITVGVSPPVITAPATALVNENGSLVFSASNGNALSLADSGIGLNADSLTMSVSQGTLTLGTTNGLVFSSGSNGAASFTVKGTVTNIDAALSSVTYQPNANYAGSDSLAISASDPGDSKSASTSVALTVSPGVPAITAPVSAVLSENGSLVFSSSNGNAISFVDAGPGADSLTLTVTHGTLTLTTTTGLTFTGSNGSASFTVTGSVANLNAALNGLTYQPATRYSGSDSLAVSLTDAGDSLSVSKSVALTINGLAPPSIGAPATASVVLNGSLVFSSANGNPISVSDTAAGGSSDSLTLGVTNGTLTLSTTTGLTFTAGTNGSSSFTVSGTMTNLNAALSGLTYQPTAGYSGVASLTISIADPGDSESASKSVALTVNAPTITAPSSAAVGMSGTLVFSAANGNAITVADSGPGASSDSLTLSVSSGTLTLSTTAGLTITAGANGSASITVTGSVASLNAALNGLTYQPTSAYKGSDSLVISLNDSVDRLSASASVALSSLAAITAPTTAVTAVTNPLVFATGNRFGYAISIADVSAGSAVEPLTLTSTDGKLTLGSTSGITFTSGANNSASMTINGTLAALNAALNGLIFSPALIGNATIVLSYADVGDGQMASATIDITVTKGVTKLGTGSPVSPPAPLLAAPASSVTAPTGAGTISTANPTVASQTTDNSTPPPDVETSPDIEASSPAGLQTRL